MLLNKKFLDVSFVTVQELLWTKVPVSFLCDILARYNPSPNEIISSLSLIAKRDIFLGLCTVINGLVTPSYIPDYLKLTRSLQKKDLKRTEIIKIPAWRGLLTIEKKVNNGLKTAEVFKIFNTVS